MNKFDVEAWNQRYFLHIESGVVIPILADAQTRYNTFTSSTL